MVNGERLKNYKFPESGTLTSTTGGILAPVYTSNPLNGMLQSIQYNYNNTTNTGSLYVFESGTGILLDTQLSFAADTVSYPRVAVTDNAAGAISNGFTERALMENIYVTGSGLGSAKNITSVEVRYK